MPLSELFERLRGAGLISEADVATLRRVLKTRNGVVHGADVTPHDVNESLHSLVRVADKLRIG
jgi:uncharacterized protein YutE (UPF0331/DUF86 family)